MACIWGERRNEKGRQSVSEASRHLIRLELRAREVRYADGKGVVHILRGQER